MAGQDGTLGVTQKGGEFKELPKRNTSPPKNMKIPGNVLPNGDKVSCVPLPKQALFLLSVASGVQDILYGGAAGGGKTASCPMICRPYLGAKLFRAVIFRKGWSHFKKIHQECEILFFPMGGIYNANEHIWKFPSGAQVWYGLASGGHAAFIENYQGTEVNIAIFDELTQWADSWYWDYIGSRIRCADPTLPLCQCGTTNPGGVGAAWVREKWKIGDEGHETFFREKILDLNDEWDGESVRIKRFLPAYLEENPYIDPEKYKEQLLSTGLTAGEVSALCDGRWDFIGGSMFAHQWTSEHIIKEFKIPDHWPIWRGYDDGWDDPSVCIWLTQDPVTKHFYALDELCSPRTLPEDLAEDILYMDEKWKGPRHTLAGVADTSLFQVNSHNSGYGRGDVLNQAGCRFRKVVKRNVGGRTSRFARVHLLRHLLAKGKDGIPRLRFFRNCKYLIKSIPILPQDERRIGDVDTTADDHGYDALTYGLMTPLTGDSSMMRDKQGRFPRHNLMTRR